MKPLRLSMQAFGPFAGLEVLDFTALGENPLFLINGPTGSGKTSLLDAMCLALFDTTTGNERQGHEMRCAIADPALETFVEFDFELHGHRYRIRRTPRQERPAVHGDRLVVKSAAATLWRLGSDGEEASGELLVESKVTDATDAIRRLTGLDAAQFRQVVVLPQGEFRRLLLANSADREKIFASLFQTGIYRRLEEQLKADADEVIKAREAHSNQLKGILELAKVSNRETLGEAIEVKQLATSKAEAVRTTKTAAWSRASQALEGARELLKTFERSDAVRSQIDQYVRDAPGFDLKRAEAARAEQAVSLNPVFDARARARAQADRAKQARDEATQSLAKALARMTEAARTFESEQHQRPELDNAKLRLNELERFSQLGTQLGQAIAHEKVATEAEVHAARALDTVRAGEAAAGARLTGLKEESHKQRTSIAQLTGQRVALAELKPRIAVRRRIDETLVRQRVAEEGRAQAKAQCAQFDEGHANARIRHQEVQRAWHLGQAALLAQSLEVGEACPVCGSTAHPAPAVFQESVPDQAQLDAAAEALEAAADQARGARNRLEALETELREIDNQLERDGAELGPMLERSAEDLATMQRTLEGDVSRLDELESAVESTSAAIALQESQLAQFAGEVKLAVEALGQTRIGLAATTAAREAAERALPEAFRHPGQLASALNESRARIAQLEARMEVAQREHGEATNAHAAAHAELGSAKLAEQEAARTLEKDAAALAAAIDQSAFDTEAERGEALRPAEMLAALQEAVRDFDTERARASAELKAYEAQLEDKQRPDLQSLTVQAEAADRERDAAEQAWKEVSNELHTLRDVERQYDGAMNQMQTLEDRYKIIGTLYEVTAGKTGDKVSLQRYVLGALLDDVLLQATARLSRMSAGRYQLIRKTERAKRGASGLDLMVYDDHSGTERTVATLSGGESFLAALSLALGLSDVVQANAGGIRLDTLFIDEGFGSLDPESLELAVRTLIDLKESGRMVGVISHVSELKEQMELRVDVHKDIRGSRLAVVA